MITLRLMGIFGTKRVLPLVARPFVHPTSPNKFLERLMLALSVISFFGSIALALYAGLHLDQPRALWAILPTVIMPSGFLWGWYDAKRKRFAAEQEVERYRDGLQRALADQ